MQKLIRTLLILVIVGAVSAGGYFLYTTNVAATTAAASSSYTQTVTVTRGNLAATVSVVGQLESQRSATLAFDYVDGTDNVATLNVAAGNTVTQGQVLATIDATLYQQALDQAKSDLAASQEALSDLQTPATALEIAQADLKVSQATVALQQAQDTLDDLENPDLTQLQLAVTEAKSALAKAQASLLSAQNDSSYEDQLYKLNTAESDASTEYSRLAAEKYSDAYYQDRLTLAYNKMLKAQDARVTYELNHKLSLLQAENSVSKATQALATAQEKLADAKAGANASANAAIDLAQAKVAVHEAEVNLQSAQEARAELDAGADATDVATAKADVDKKTLAVADAEAALAGAQIVAPFDGTVLETDVAAGDQVTRNTAVLTVANLQALQVVASVDEPTIREVSAGQQVSITFDAFPGQTFTGQVLSVPLQGSLEGDVMVYDVPVSLSGAEDIALRVGMTANCEIQAGGATDVLLVPTIALTQSDNGYQVQVADSTNSNGKTVQVEIGLSNGTYTEIKSGLSEGDQVLVTLTASSSSSTQMGGAPLDGGGPAGGQQPAQPAAQPGG